MLTTSISVRASLLPLFMLASVTVVSCGGGSGSGGSLPTAAETTSLQAPTPILGYVMKSVILSWDAVDGADHYRLLEDPDGGSGYSQVGGDIDTTTVSHTIPLHLRINARYIVQACDSIGCSDSAPLTMTDHLIPAIGYVKASNTGDSDHFGYQLAVSSDGTTLAVGAYGEASSAQGIDNNQLDNSAPLAGAVYIFTHAAGDNIWSQQAYLKASNTDAGDRFGYTIAISGNGNTVAVGAYNEDGGSAALAGDESDNSATEAGAVYLYQRTGTNWSQQSYIKASNANTNARFGSAVALSADGTTLAVGAPGEQSNATGINSDQADTSAPNAGAAYLFAFNGGSWEQQAYIKSSNSKGGDLFGVSLSLSADGNLLAVGATGEDSNTDQINGDQSDVGASGAGAVYLFARSGSVWSQQSYIKASNSGSDDAFGASVALSTDGLTLAVGAIGERSNAVGINNDQSDDSLPYAGAAYLFAFNGSLWEQQAYIKASNTSTYQNFGTTLALSANGDLLAVGANGEKSNAQGINGDGTNSSAASAGAFYLYRRTAGIWAQKSYGKAPNTDAYDYFATSLVLSGDGMTLAVGAHHESGGAVGVGGDPNDNSVGLSGAVYLY